MLRLFFLFSFWIPQVALVTVLLTNSAYALGRSPTHENRCDFSATADRYLKLVRQHLRSNNHPEGLNRPPALALYLVGDSGTIVKRLAETSVDDPRPIASTQKILTAWVVAKTASLETLVTIQPEDDWHDSANDGNPARRRDGSLIQIGDTASVRELLQTMLEQSSNAAAAALARAVLGSHENFVRQMNIEAQSLLASSSSTEDRFDTYFQNPSGLTDTEARLRNAELPITQHSTANNLARLMAKLFQRPHSPGSFNFALFIKQLDIWNYVSDGTFEKHGKTRAAGRTVVVHWRLPDSCRHQGDALVLAAFGSTEDHLNPLILEIEGLVGLTSHGRRLFQVHEFF